MSANTEPLIWANLIHLSYNMWSDSQDKAWTPHINPRPYLRFDDSLWNDLLTAMPPAGVNMVVLDLGDAVQYASHPEIVIENAWSRERLRQELAVMRAKGLEPIPKLNFSAAHDTWMGPYARRVSTPEYYTLCKDLIAEVIELFDHPRLFHLGMDEETAEHQRLYEYVVVRQHDLWWRDFYFLVEQVEQAGVRPWIWSDYVWVQPELFYRKMPKSVIQSNWYYEKDFNPTITAVKAYLEIEEHGFDQIPTASNWSSPENFELTVEFCKKHIAPERLRGFIQTPWHPTLEQYRAHHLQAVDCIGGGLRAWSQT